MSERPGTPIRISVRTDQLAALRYLARRRRVSVAELVRQSIDQLLDEIVPEEDPLWELVGIVDGGPPDLAERHDEYLSKLVSGESSL